MHSDRDALKNIAEKKYFELLQYFENDRSIAKALTPHYGRSNSVLKRNLGLFSFRNQKSTQDFIDAANVVLAKIKVQEINATALLFIGFDMSPIVLVEQAKKLIDLGINVIAPQAIIENTHEQFWEYVKADIALSDFIVIYEVNDVENTLLQDTAKDKEIIDIQDINDLKAYARRVTLKKCKSRVK
ncbi:MULTISPECIES: hypothetical protein [unclassified Sulfurospirillum]|uniref:hypothetical protein n=1 Tax=unclassified Sulfurospirillum TaxID=2618290 RepID=UPI000500D2AD|nr:MULTISPECIES: hypothetical protein [unclassified Sulfurospirillum]KFL35001.1 hypothetical protein JU57_03290 [Sulfurospirillum sp. SCADC]